MLERTFCKKKLDAIYLIVICCNLLDREAWLTSIYGQSFLGDVY